MAYAVRKTLMEESIYSMKLIARGHNVPEGFQRPFVAAQRVGDVMMKNFVVIPAGGPAPTGQSMGIVEANGVIVGLMKQPPAAANAATAVMPTHDYVIVGDHAPLLKALLTMAEAEAAVMLVSTNLESRKAENIVGVVTLATVAQLLKQAEGIS